MTSGSKRTKKQLERDRAETARLYLMGLPQYKIAEQIGVTQQQICYDLKRIRENWLKSALVDFNEVKGRELDRIDLLEKEAWDAWRRSQLNAETVTQTVRGARANEEGNPKVVEETFKTVGQVGDPRFLDKVQWCIEQRCKIFGLYEPERHMVTWQQEVEQIGGDAGEIFERLVNEAARVIGAGDSDPGS